MVIFHSKLLVYQRVLLFFAIEPLILDMEMGQSCNLDELGVIHSEFPERIEQ